MDNQINEQSQATVDQNETDPWAAAFAALEQTGTQDSEEPTASDGDDSSTGDSSSDTGGNKEVSADVQANDSTGDEATVGGLGSDVGEGNQEDGSPSEGLFDIDVSEESIKQYRDDFAERVREQAIDEIAKEFIKRGVRNTNGMLGATIDDADVCKRDEDGVPRFYNPETGREFTGDNPRRQAQEWVDDYNKELARVFNNAPSLTYAYYFANIKPKPPVAAKRQTGWVCKICGYVYEGEDLPADFICPLCKHPASDFEKLK